MILGHEEFTSELTQEEIQLAHDLIKHFGRKTKDNPVKARDIVEGVKNTYKLSFKFDEARLRKIVNYYRVNYIIPILSSKNGYYVSEDPEDIKAMTKSLSQRASSIIDCVIGLDRWMIERGLI